MPVISNGGRPWRASQRQSALSTSKATTLPSTESSNPYETGRDVGGSKHSERTAREQRRPRPVT